MRHDVGPFRDANAGVGGGDPQRIEGDRWGVWTTAPTDRTWLMPLLVTGTEHLVYGGEGACWMQWPAGEVEANSAQSSCGVATGGPFAYRFDHGDRSA